MPVDSSSQAAVQRARDRDGGGGASWEKGAEEGGGERGAASHSQLPHTSVWTFISDTKEEARPLGEVGAGRPSCIMHFTSKLFSSPARLLARVLS